VIPLIAVIDLISIFTMLVLVLLHSGRGGGLSDMFGGAGTTALGSTAAERNLNRITVIVALVFVICTVALGLMLD